MNPTNPSTYDPAAAREFAVQVVRTLRAAGFQALWAGGCVRDRLLGLEPDDYDVATEATPDQIQEVFGHRRTLAIGKAFGVITVLGPRRAGQIEVATFRRDATYSDGRHPDQVTFTGAEEDARRRDFTINGLFFDPLENRVLDFVGGQADLERRVVRAIGDPYQRIAEDKLRMLRAVRFAATFRFDLDPATLAAVQQQAPEIRCVSAERIAAELRRMLVHPHRRAAVELLVTSRLLAAVLPELQALASDDPARTDCAGWSRTLQILQRLEEPSFPVAFAVLVHQRYAAGGGRTDVAEVVQRLKLTNQERDIIRFVLEHETAVRAARRIPWPQLQRILIEPYVGQLLTYAQAVAEVAGEEPEDLAFCRQKLALPREQLNPPPLVSGDDLRAAGRPPGPAFKRVLTAVRDAQLEQRVRTKDEALAFARELLDPPAPVE